MSTDTQTCAPPLLYMNYVDKFRSSCQFALERGPRGGPPPRMFLETVAAIATRLTLTFKRTGSLPKATPLVVNLEK